jgi:hypothetical protein
MALSATFTANFASFYDAVDKADAKLKDFGDGADKVGGRLTALGNQFSGKKIVQEATLMAKAVEDIGGVSALTDKELARLGATANEAVAKMQKLGMDVPKNLQAIADATKDANTKTTDWMGSITNVAAAMGVTFSIGAFAGFASHLVEAGSHIADLSSKLDISTEAVQRWGYAAELSGGTIDDVGAAIAFMNKTLAGGSDSTVAALGKVGLQFDQIRKMSPEEAFDAITEAIRKIPDPMEQARVAAELFGKGAATILPAIRDGFREVGAQAAVMSDDTIGALDKAGDTWTRFFNRLEVAGAGIIGTLDDIGTWRDNWLAALAQGSSMATTAIDKAAQHVTKLGGEVPVAKDATAALAAYNATMGDSETKLRAAIAAQDEHTKKIKALADTITGQDVVRKANDLAEALKAAGGASHLSAGQVDDLMDQMNALIKGPLGFSALPKSLKDVYLAHVDLTAGIRETTQAGEEFFRAMSLGGSVALPEYKNGIKIILADSQTDYVKHFADLEKADDQSAKARTKIEQQALDAQQQAHARFVGAVTQEATILFDGFVHGWDAFKQASTRVFDDVLAYFEQSFVKGLLGQLGVLDGGWASAFGRMGSMSASTASGAAASWIGAMGSIATFAAGIGLPFLIGSLINPGPPHSPTPVGPGTPAPPPTNGGGTVDENAAELAYAQALFDEAQSLGGGQAAMQLFNDYMYTRPNLWGQGQGFAGGTHGQFLNFGAGTPVVLHGWEAVVPRGEALAPSIVINAQGAFFDTPGDLQRLADRVNDALTAKFGLQNMLRAG